MKDDDGETPNKTMGDGYTSNDLGLLYKTYRPKVTQYVKGKIGYNNPDSEDMVEDIFQKAVDSYASFDESQASFSTWIYRLSHNMVVDYFRKKSTSRVCSLEDMMETSFLTGEDNAEEANFANKLRLLSKGLKALAQRERDIIILHYYHEVKLAKIAEMMKLSYINIRVLKSRAIQKLKKYVISL